MTRKLFCEISPFTYKLSMEKEILKRTLKDKHNDIVFAKEISNDLLPYVIYSNKSLIRRRLGNVNMELQENKAINLSIAAPLVNGVIIKPNETFSFWHLVGRPTIKKGYKEGLTIANNEASSGIGGGMCQFTNLIHWLVLHTPLEIIERHHHDQFDLFPDFGRQIPFGTGTSIVYNYLDYRFKNVSAETYQLIVKVDGEYLVGEIRSTAPIKVSYHIHAVNEFFTRENNDVYRNGQVIRDCIDKTTGISINKEIIQINHAKVMYDSSSLEIKEL